MYTKNNYPFENTDWRKTGMEQELNFLSWNTSLYTYGNKLENGIKKIDYKVVADSIELIKKYVNEKDGIAILQEIPYKINTEYIEGMNRKYNKWDEHPIFSKLKNTFLNDSYDVLYDESYKYRIKQTVIIAKKDKIEKWETVTNNNIYYGFCIDGLKCLGVHAHNAFELWEWINKNQECPDLIAGDFNSGNYLLSDDKKDSKLKANRNNYLHLLEGYIDIFQGMDTTNYPECSEQRQIDHVLIKNTKDIRKKYSYENIKVDTTIQLSDHFPLYWSLKKKDNHE